MYGGREEGREGFSRKDLPRTSTSRQTRPRSTVRYPRDLGSEEGLQTEYDPRLTDTDSTGPPDSLGGGKIFGAHIYLSFRRVEVFYRNIESKKTSQTP